jgi:hypothetical protein
MGGRDVTHYVGNMHHGVGLLRRNKSPRSRSMLDWTIMMIGIVLTGVVVVFQ